MLEPQVKAFFTRQNFNVYEQGNLFTLERNGHMFSYEKKADTFRGYLMSPEHGISRALPMIPDENETLVNQVLNTYLKNLS